MGKSFHENYFFAVNLALFRIQFGKNISRKRTKNEIFTRNRLLQNFAKEKLAKYEKIIAKFRIFSLRISITEAQTSMGRWTDQN